MTGPRSKRSHGLGGLCVRSTEASWLECRSEGDVLECLHTWYPQSFGCFSPGKAMGSVSVGCGHLSFVCGDVLPANHSWFHSPDPSGVCTGAAPTHARPDVHLWPGVCMPSLPAAAHRPSPPASPGPCTPTAPAGAPSQGLMPAPTSSQRRPLAPLPGSGLSDITAPLQSISAPETGQHHTSGHPCLQEPG